MAIPENEQWLLNGHCSKCRRANYCKQPCTKNKRRVHAQVRSAVMSVMTKGMPEEFKEQLDKTVSKYNI